MVDFFGPTGAMTGGLSLVKGGLDLYASIRADKARKEAAEKDRRFQQQKIGQVKQAVTGPNQFTGADITQTPGGGFNVGVLSGSPQEATLEGDLERQIKANELTRTPTAPSQETINEALLARDTLNFDRFEDTRNKFLEGLLRKPGARDNNTGFLRGATREIGDFATANRANTPVEELTLASLLNQQGAQTRGQELANLSSRLVPVQHPGANIAQVIGAQGLIPTPTDLSGAIPGMAGSGFISDLQAQHAARQEDQRFNKALDAILAQNRHRGASGSGTFEIPPARNEEIA